MRNTSILRHGSGGIEQMGIIALMRSKPARRDIANECARLEPLGIVKTFLLQ